MSGHQSGGVAGSGVYIDRNGVRYTDHCFARIGDPWLGALILTPRVIARLRRDGLLPLTGVPR